MLLCDGVVKVTGFEYANEYGTLDFDIIVAPAALYHPRTAWATVRYVVC